jgi:hypothetical protein
MASPPLLKAAPMRQPLLKSSAPIAARPPGMGVSPTAMFPQRTGGSNQAALALLAQQKAARPGAAAANGAAPGTQAPVAKLPPLSPELREEMVADVEAIVRILKKGTPTTGDQTYLLEAVRTWQRRDHELSGQERGARRTPILDHFLILLKSRAFSRVTFRIPGTDVFTVEQHAIVYDTLWYELRGYWLEEFKRVVKQSETQRTEGAESKDIENGAALIAKQEAMGLWGMLKGMGTGLVSVAGPEAAHYVGAQFDETAHILFGHEWDSSEPLVWGMNAGQIGTAGGDVIMQLAMFARTAGAKGGRILQLLNNLDKLKRAQQVLGVLSGVQGVLIGVKGIVEVVDAQRKLGKEITADSLIHDPAFVNNLVMLVSSGVAIALAIKGAPTSAKQAVTRARIHALLSSGQFATTLADLVHNARSDKSDLEKELEYGRILTGLIPQLVSLVIAGHGLQQARQGAAQERRLEDENKSAAGAKADQDSAMDEAALDAQARTAQSDQTPRLEAEAEPASKTMSGPADPAPAASRRTNAEIEAARKPIAEAHQAAMLDEVQNRLAPRDAPTTPADVAAGVREPLFKPATGNKSKTIGKPVASLEHARQLYDQVLAETGGRFEAGIWQHPDTGEYVVQLGQASAVSAPDRKTPWRAVQHFHPNTSDIPLWRMPAGADVSELVQRVVGEGRTMTEIVEYPLPNGKRGRVAYTVTTEGQLSIEYINSDGQRVSKPFGKVADFDSYHGRKIGATQDIRNDVDQWLEARRNNTIDTEAEPATKTAFGAAPKKPGTAASAPDAKRSKAVDEEAAATELWKKSKKAPQGDEEAKLWANKASAKDDDDFADVRKEMGNKMPTQHKGGIKQAMKDAEGFPRSDKPGEINLESFAHKDASDVRKVQVVKGKDFQSAHAGASSWLSKRIWRNNKLLNIRYSRANAFTTLLPPSVHQSFDKLWKAFAIESRQAGTTKVPVSEMVQVMRKAVAGSSVPDAKQGPLMTMIEAEVAGLGLDWTDLIELPYPNVKAVP